MQQRLSIVMCTFNGAAYLQAQLDSLLNQSRRPDEIVISDDASTDASMEIASAFKPLARGHGIDVQILRHSSTLGYVANFSFALQHASGDVVFMCDQDDLWQVDKLAVMAARFDAEPELLLLHSDARLVDAQGCSLGCTLFQSLQLTDDEKQAIHRGNAFDVVLRRSFVTGATAAIRRELVQLALPVAPDWIHDEWLAAVAAATGRLDFIEAALIDYRQHGANQLGARRRTWAMKWHDLKRPRETLLSQEAGRLRSLEDYFVARGRQSDSEYAALIQHARTYLERRLALGRLPRLRRLLPILREARAGNYRRYGTGAPPMVRDLLRRA